MKFPISQACENNKTHILKALKKHTIPGRSLLELGSYTGQHAEYMANKLELNWQTSDMPSNLWILEKKYSQKNGLITNRPMALEVLDSGLSPEIKTSYDYIYTANTLHIMSEHKASIFCSKIGQLLKKDGLLFIYGPFKFLGEFTSESNYTFNQWLKDRDSLSGIRDFEFIQAGLKDSNLESLEVNDLPANNHLLVFKKT